MGPIGIFYIAFASISLFACILQLFISFRKKGDILFLVSALLSLVVFIHFAILVLCANPLGMNCPPFTLLRYQLILSQAVIICMLGTLFHLLKSKTGLFFLGALSVSGLLLLTCLFVPDQALFGENAAIRQMTLTDGDQIVMISTGFTLWRAMKDLTILIFVISSFVLLLKKLEDVTFNTLAVLFAGLAIVLTAALFDQFIDLGQINMTYMLPLAVFIFYSILTFIPFVILIEENITQEKIIHQEKSLHDLIDQADLIVVKLNRMGIVESVNPYFFTLTGYNEDEVLGKDWFEFFIPPKEYYNVQGTFVEILEYEFHPQYLNPILSKSKEELLIRWFNVRTLNSQGKITGSLSIGLNVSEEEKEKEQLIKKIKGAELLISKLSSPPGHD
jgi:PAS domain S-box-containing protein